MSGAQETGPARSMLLLWAHGDDDDRGSRKKHALHRERRILRQRLWLSVEVGLILLSCLVSIFVFNHGTKVGVFFCNRVANCVCGKKVTRSFAMLAESRFRLCRSRFHILIGNFHAIKKGKPPFGSSPFFMMQWLREEIKRCSLFSL